MNTKTIKILLLSTLSLSAMEKQYRLPTLSFISPHYVHNTPLTQTDAQMAHYDRTALLDFLAYSPLTQYFTEHGIFFHNALAVLDEIALPNPLYQKVTLSFISPVFKILLITKDRAENASLTHAHKAHRTLERSFTSTTTHQEFNENFIPSYYAVKQQLHRYITTKIAMDLHDATILWWHKQDTTEQIQKIGESIANYQKLARALDKNQSILYNKIGTTKNINTRISPAN